MKWIFSKLKKHRYLSFCFLFIITILIILFIIWLGYIRKWPEKQIYYYNSFDQSIKDWRGLDFEWKTQQDKDKIISLSRKKYLTPYFMHKLSLEESPPETFVWHFQVFIDSFTDEAVTVGTVLFPIEPLVLVVDQKGRLGVSHSLFAAPAYSTSLKKHIRKKQWEDIYVFIDNTKQQYTVYINNKKVISNTWKAPTYPLKEIWLGCIWIKGGGGYGSPLGVSYNNITLGTKGILPKPSFPQFILECIDLLFELF